VEVIDADRIGHQVLREPDVLNSLRKTFGETVIRDGAVDRGALARLVFGPESHHKESLSRLEAIVHPRIREQIETDMATAEGRVDTVILDAAVLLEAGWNDLCHAVAFVETPEETRQERVLLNRGWTASQLAARESSQMSLEEKRQAADFVIDNSGSVDDSVCQLAEGIQALRSGR